MAISHQPQEDGSKTTYPTKRVFMRAEHKDVLQLTEVVSQYNQSPIPEAVTVIRRDLTYYGPKLRVESDDFCEQFLLTAPGPDMDALFWRQINGEWEKVAEVRLNFETLAPQYDICLHCNEPLSTAEHRRLSYIGACTED